MNAIQKNNRLIFFLLLCFSMFCIPIHSQNTKEKSTEDSFFKTTFVKPQNVIKVGEGHYFIDFGKDAFGTLVLKSKSGISDLITIHLGEKTASSNSIDRKPGGSIRYQMHEVKQIAANAPYTLNIQPYRRNTKSPAIALPDSFGVIMPFRYCEIENLKTPIEDLEVLQKVFSWQFNDNASSFISSDTVLNKVWDMCKHTIKATSFAGYYIDGDRERTPYEADAYINQLAHYCFDNEYRLARRTNEYFINHPTWPTEWILLTATLFYNDYMYTGDLKPLAKYYDALKNKSLLALQREDGLISTQTGLVTGDLIKKIGFEDSNTKIKDIVDWPQSPTGSDLSVAMGENDGYDMVKVSTVVNAYHYNNLKIMAEIAGVLGKKDDFIYFRKQAALVKESINQKLFDKSRGVYVDGEGSVHASLHANMFPLAFGLVPKERISTVVSFVKSRGMACSVYGAQFLLEGLYNSNQADYALELMSSTSDRSWWNMIRAGSTIALEAWDMKYKPNSDWNHPWGAAPGNIVTRNMWGIIPDLPGFAKAKIKPQLGKLTFSKIKVPTIKGYILAEYKTSGKNEEYTITLPKNMQAEFIWEQNRKVKIILNHKEIKTSKENINLKSGSNKIEILSI